MYWTKALEFSCGSEHKGVFSTHLLGLGRFCNNSGSTWEQWQQAWVRWWQASMHLESLYRSQGKTTSPSGMLLVLLEIVVATYH
jgi:hypothetical protein